MQEEQGFSMLFSTVVITVIDKPEEMKAGFSKVVPSHLEKVAFEFSSSTLLSAQLTLLFWL